ncbi:MAG: hypothetical protein ACM3PV_06355 [Betaproteobacteria bacterium]
MLRRVWTPASWAAAAAWPFWGPLFDGRVLFFRDVSVTYYPDLVFLQRALAQGVWPLWHPGADAGAPFLAAYPVHLALVALLGARATLALSPWLHVFIAMLAAGVLANRLQLGPAGRWTAGCVYALSGWMLGSVLYPVFLAAAWLPLAVALALDVFESPRPRVVAALAAVLALQVATLGAEVIPQTAIAALALAPRLPARRTVLGLLAAGALAGLLASPAWAGAVWMLQGTARAGGFGPDVALSYSASLPVLLEAALPRFLGDPHTFSDLGYWGQPFFPEGSPFFLSLYLGPVVLLLAARAGRRPWRLWVLAAIGVLLAAGAHGPLGPAMAPAMRFLRVPPKFFLLATLALSLLAGRGVDRARRGGWGLAAVLPGLLLLLAALLAWRWPSAVVGVVAAAIPEAAGPLARQVIARCWPAELALTGSLALGAGLALARGGAPLSLLAALLAVLDLARVNGSLNPAAPPGFYDLRPPVQRLVGAARAEGTYRWFSYGVALSGPLTWRPEVTRRNADVWLYYLDRQSLLPRTQVLDGLDGAFDVDRMGLAPRGSTLEVAEAHPARFREHYDRLRAANVRWVLSFAPLPEDLVSPRGEVRFPEVAESLRLFELRDPLPRAYYVDRLEHALGHGAPAQGPAQVVYEAVDPHTVRLRCRTPPGFIVVLDGYNADWKALDGSHAVPVQPVAGRYRAVPTPGGDRVITLKLTPPWRAPALACLAFGGVLTLGLLVVPGVSGFTGTRRPPC